MTTLTRADIATTIYQKTGISFSEASELVDGLIEELTDGLQQKRKVKISSFGTFEVRHKAERVGRNPKTKEAAIIKARDVVSFYPSNTLVSAVNGEDYNAS